MGPNGSGKSTLASVLAGRDKFTVTGGSVTFGENLLDMTVERRACEGLFIGFQYPVEIPGEHGLVRRETSPLTKSENTMGSNLCRQANFSS